MISHGDQIFGYQSQFFYYPSTQQKITSQQTKINDQIYQYIQHLYTNTLLDGSVILSVCSFAIETTFPLSNFKSKHTFGILMTPRKFLNLGRRHSKFVAPQVPQFFFVSPPKAADTAASAGAPPVPQTFFIFYRRERRRFPKWAPTAPEGRHRKRRSAGERRKSRRRRVLREFIHNSIFPNLETVIFNQVNTCILHHII